MGFPAKQLSYKLQGLIGQRSTEEDYRESVSMLNELLGLSLEGSHVKRVIEDLAPLVDPYYEQRPTLTKSEAEEEGTYLAFGNDGKGVPIIKQERKGAKQDEEARLMKGQKRGIKKEATVSVSFSFNPQIRDSEAILRGLFRESAPEELPQREAKRISINVHKRAFLANQKGGIDYAIRQIGARDPDKTKPIIALVDCGPGLEGGILEKIKEHGLQENLDAIIADIVHVSEYIWDAANVILGERFKGRTPWVRSVIKDLLESKTEKVIKELEANRDRTNLTDSKKEKLQKVITYLSNHKHKMDYKTYLEKGYPISTGLIEGCCGHLVKDRMERSGMRWTMKGAQNMLDLRALKKNGDWNSFMNFVQDFNQPGKIQIRA